MADGWVVYAVKIEAEIIRDDDGKFHVYICTTNTVGLKNPDPVEWSEGPFLNEEKAMTMIEWLYALPDNDKK